MKQENTNKTREPFFRRMAKRPGFMVEILVNLVIAIILIILIKVIL